VERFSQFMNHQCSCFAPIAHSWPQTCSLFTSFTIVLADLTEVESNVQAFPFILPDLSSIPVQPLLHLSKHETPMLSNISTSPWILPLAQYQDQPHLMRLLSEYLIDSVQEKAIELAKRQ
jgi:hypothetical protein